MVVLYTEKNVFNKSAINVKTQESRPLPLITHSKADEQIQYETVGDEGIESAEQGETCDRCSLCRYFFFCVFFFLFFCSNKLVLRSKCWRGVRVRRGAGGDNSPTHRTKQSCIITSEHFIRIYANKERKRDFFHKNYIPFARSCDCNVTFGGPGSLRSCWPHDHQLYHLWRV